MPKINVNITGISTVKNKIKGVRTERVQTARTEILKIRDNLDGRVAAYCVQDKDNLFNRLTWVHSSIQNAETDLRIIEDILERAYTLFETAESNLENEVSKLDYGRRASFHEFMLAYQSLFGNDAAFSSTHKGSSGRTHGGGGSGSFGNGSGGGGFRGINITDELKKLYLGYTAAVSPMSVPMGIIITEVVSNEKNKKLYDDTLGKFDSAIGAIKGLAELRDVLVKEEKGAFTEAIEKYDLPKPFTEAIKYGTYTKEFIDAVASKDVATAVEKVRETGMEILKDASGLPGIVADAAVNVGESIGNHLCESYTEYWNDPSVETFGNMIYSSTLKAGNEGITKTAYEVVEKIPGLGEWMTGEYERLSGKTGVEGVIDCQKKLLNIIVEDGGGFNGYLEGVELMCKGIKKGATNLGKNIGEGISNGTKFVVNGFKSIFT